MPPTFIKTVIQISLLFITLSSEVSSEPLGKSGIKNVTDPSFRRLDTTELQLVETPTARLIWTSAKPFKLFWASLGQGKAPEIDFSKEYVIGAFSGFKPNPGHGIKVVSLKETVNNLAIYYQESSPSPEFDYPSVLAFPLDIIVVKGALPSHYSFIKKN